MRGRLAKSQNAFGRSLLGLLGGGDLDEASWDEIEDTLLIADLGPAVTASVVAKLRAALAANTVSSEAEARAVLREVLIGELHGGLDRSIKALPHDDKPSVLLVVGVNGTGKTTTVGKLARVLVADGRRVVLGAADTFRAAAVDQLKIWSERAGVPIVAQGMNADPASVAYDTLQSAVASGSDVVIIDTAGRLHNKINLMNELTKIKRVMQKVIPDAPHEVLLVLDGSTGQNAVEQARQFTKATEVTALALTKIDGTAKGGVVIGISDEFKIPVRYIGVGEGINDLQVFNKFEFVDSLFSEN